MDKSYLLTKKDIFEDIRLDVTHH